MKLLCKRNVQDRYTGENYKAGEVYEFEGERAEQVYPSNKSSPRPKAKQMIQ